MKTCIKCKQNKSFGAFYKKKGTRDGLFQWCIPCHKIVTSERHANRRKEDLIFAIKESQKVLKWRKQNPEKYQNSVKKYAKYNLPKLIAKANAYRARKINRTPKWLSDSDLWMMQEAYDFAALRTKMFGFSWHVDHIIPLKGKNVSGFHVPSNLRVIPGIENQTKSNKYLT